MQLGYRKPARKLPLTLLCHNSGPGSSGFQKGQNSVQWQVQPDP